MCEESRSMPFVQLGCTCKGAMAFAHKVLKLFFVKVLPFWFSSLSLFPAVCADNGIQNHSSYNPSILKVRRQKCAKSWFIPLAQGKAEGLALDRNWALRWFCRCEICGHNLDERFVEELVLSCQERLKRGSTEEGVRCGAWCCSQSPNHTTITTTTHLICVLYLHRCCCLYTNSIKISSFSNTHLTLT